MYYQPTQSQEQPCYILDNNCNYCQYDLAQDLRKFNCQSNCYSNK